MSNGQKFVGRNRPPRVQIEYDLETYGSAKKVELPFVMGVMSDLSGKPKEKLEPVANRKFLDVDIDNFDRRMKAMKPRVDFRVPNTLTRKGELKVDMTFESLEDFKPAAIARKVNGLNRLYEVRKSLETLLAYMDGRTGAESLVSRLLEDKDLLKILGEKRDSGKELFDLISKNQDSKNGEAPSSEREVSTSSSPSSTRSAILDVPAEPKVVTEKLGDGESAAPSIEATAPVSTPPSLTLNETTQSPSEPKE